MSGVDWATTNGCPRCDEHGPFLPLGVIDPEAARTAHQAWHTIAAEVLRPFVALLDRFAPR